MSERNSFKQTSDNIYSNFTYNDKVYTAYKEVKCADKRF